MNTHHPSSSVPLVDNQQAAQERLETPEGRREFWRATFSITRAIPIFLQN